MTSAPLASTPREPTDAARRARRIWRLLEPVHAVVYFSPDARARFEAVGLKGYWMGYFASRAGVLGPVGPEVVEALFYVFSPRMVARALPDAWQLSTPEAVLDARHELAHTTLRQALGELADSDDVRTAAELALPVAQAAPWAGRPLAAANAALPVPPADDPVAQLWWAATVLREHRGDGHMSTLLAADVDPCGALVLAAATDGLGADGAALLQSTRKWTDDEWAAASARLAERGWLDVTGQLTDVGRAAHQDIEDTTDLLAAPPYRAVGDADLDALIEALRPLTRQIARSGAYPTPNPVGLDPTTDSDGS